MSELAATQTVGTNPVPDETGLCAAAAAANLPQAHDGPSTVDHRALTAGRGNVADLDHSDRCTATLSIAERVGACVHCSSWDWIPPDDDFPPEDLYYPTDPDLPGGPPVITAQDHVDAELDELLGRNRLSRVDDLEWEEWHGIDQDDAEREMLRRDAPAWVSLPPGGDLATALESTRPQAMSPIVLIELVKAASRLSGWVEAIKITAMASFYRQRQAEHAASPRPSQVDASGRPIDPERSWHAEIALALGLSKDTVARRVATALRLTGPLQSTRTALKCGALTWGKALAISEATADLPDQAARAVEAHVLKRAAAQTHKNLLESLRRQVAKHRAAEEADEHHAAVAERTCKIVPLANGMAGLWIVHTADKIQQIWVTIHAMATLAKRHTPTSGDPTATDARPGLATADAEPPTAPPPAPPGQGDPDHTTTIATGGGATSHAPTTEPHPAGTTATADATSDCVKDARTAEQRRADVAADLFEHILRNGLDWLGRKLPDQHRRRPHIEVVVPASTLLGLDDDPAELIGYGPIPAGLARRIATDGTWRRLLTDPVNGAVLEASTTRHDPGTLVTETLLARHPVCAWPGCNRASRDCDRDHTTSFAQTGTTSLAGLAPYCEYHHVIKDTPAWGWTSTSHPDGSITLTTPTGHRYTTVPLARGPITRPPDTGPSLGQCLRRPGPGPTVELSPHELRRQSAADGRTAASDPPPF
ncbi:hypothetical protein ACIBL3_26805 [Kribbella sp. NPDC050124]|uniref:hypothetical protein n=1 Tax=Kribbella sp. NPDC050124 TaxID=3364114 RepID=UPI00379740D7